MRKFIKFLTFAVSLLFGVVNTPHLSKSTATKEEPVLHVKRATDPLPEFSDPHLVFHYFLIDNKYTGWKLWLWAK